MDDRRTDTIAFQQTVLIGLAVSSHSTTTAATATFDHVLVESLWTNQDIGAVGLAGSTSISNGVFTLTGAGADIWGTADAFHFTYQRLTGDGEIVARVATVQRRVAANGVSTSTAGPLLAAPQWVKIGRVGNVITASYSSDGTTWNLVGAETIAMQPTVYIGVANSSHSTTALGTATVDGVKR